MQTLRAQQSDIFGFIDCRYQSVDDFLHECHLDQYLQVFLSEGFDSVISLLEVTEEDMIYMNVKRGHRRLIQREIANVKGISGDQPLAANMMAPIKEYECRQGLPSNTPMKMDDLRRMNNSNSTSNSTSNIYNNSNNLLASNLPVYDSNATGLTSPRSMNSGIGGSASTSFGQPQHQSLGQVDPRMSSYLAKPSINKNGNPINEHQGDPIEANSISSNDDADSIDTNESAPTKRKYQRHAKPDCNAPIKPPSAYIMFSNDCRAELKDQNFSFSELAKIVGEQWKNLSHMDKQTYERGAMRAKDEYLAALEQYRQTPQYHRYQEYMHEFKSKQDAANRVVGRARKRVKQESPGSGSIADSSSNGNSNGNGSSADTDGDKESVVRRQRHAASDDEAPQLFTHQEQISCSANNNQPQTCFSAYNDSINSNATNSTDTFRFIHNLHPHQRPPPPPQSSDSGYASQSYCNRKAEHWKHRSNQIMRGLLPVEFVSTKPASDATSSSYRTKHIINDVDMDDDQEYDDQVGEDEYVDGDDTSCSYHIKRRSPRFNKSRFKSKPESSKQA